MPLTDPFAQYGPRGSLSSSLLEAQPEAAWQKWLTAFPGGSDFNSAFYNWAKPQFRDYLGGYYGEASKPQNLGLSWLDYLKDMGQPGEAWQGMSPAQRGESPGRFMRPTVFRMPGL